MQRQIIGSTWNRSNRNGLNGNFEYLFQGSERITQLNNRAEDILGEARNINETNVDTNTRLDNIIGNLTEDAEIIDARGGLPVLKDRLDKFDERFDSMRINAMHPPAPLVGVVSDANYYDEENFKYYKDAEMTIPATDNKPALQGIVNYLDMLGGGTIELPKGEYVTRSNIQWRTKVSLIGAGKTETKLFAEGDVFSVITGLESRAGDGSDYGKESVWFEDCKFTDFLVDSKGLSYPERTVSGKSLFILYMRRAVFRDLILLNSLGTALGCDFLDDTQIENVLTIRAGRSLDSSIGPLGGQSGIGIGTSALAEETVVVSNCFAYDSGNYGIFVESQQNPNGTQSKYAKIVNSHAQGNRLGFGNKGSGGTQFISCTAYNNRFHGFHLAQGSSGDQLIGCVSEYNGREGIHIAADYVGDLDISHIRTNHNGGSGIRSLNNINTLKNVRLTHIQTHLNGSCGVWLGMNGYNLKLIDIDAVNNGQDTSLSASHRRGILVDRNNNVVSVLDNAVIDDQSENTQHVGIDIKNTVTNYILSGNNVIGYDDAYAYVYNPDNGTIGSNSGMANVEAKGTAMFNDGQKAIYINHYLGASATKVILTPMGEERVWLKDNYESNRLRIERETSVGVLEVMYIIS